MNKKQQELLDKCVRVNVNDDIPLLDGILIIQQRRLHDSGYRMMYVIGQTFEDDKYYLLSTYSDNLLSHLIPFNSFKYLSSDFN